MSKLPKVKKKTWKKFIPTKWMVWVCEPNNVHHLVLQKGEAKWLSTTFLEDCKDVIVFNKFDKAKDFIRKCIKKKLLPKGVTNVEYAQVVPTFEDGKLWYEIYDGKTGKVDYQNKTKKETL